MIAVRSNVSPLVSPRMRARGLISTVVLLTFGSLASGASAQIAPPTWWGDIEEGTVSTCYDHEPPNSNWPPTPGFLVAPSWFVLDPPNQWQRTGSWIWQATYAGRAGVWISPGAQTATLQSDLDNDPKPNSIKEVVFECAARIATQDRFRFEVLEPMPIAAQSYQLRNVRRFFEPRPNGWGDYRLKADIYPCPGNERFRMSIDSNDGATDGAIDDVYQGTRCIKQELVGIGMTPSPALGSVVPFGAPARLRTNVDNVTGNSEARAVCYTERETSPGVFERRFWIAARSAGAVGHLLFELDPGQPPGSELVATYVQPALPGATSSDGFLEMTVIPELGGGGRTLIYGVRDLTAGLPAAGRLTAFDVGARQWSPADDVVLSGGTLAATPGGLAYQVDGNSGAGSFWLATESGVLHEFRQNGVLRRSIPTGAAGLRAISYDPTLGKLFMFGRQGAGSDPRGVQVVGRTFDVASLAFDGTGFYGDLTVGGTSPGGRAESLFAHRRNDGRLRLTCLATGNATALYELSAPFQYGLSCAGGIAMDGVPWLGNSNWRVRLEGVYGASAAALYVGFDRTNWFGTPLPIELDILGLPRCALLTSFVGQVGSSPVIGDEASVAFPLPNQPAISYLPIYLQWLILDPTAPGGVTTSPAGATVVY